MPASHQAFFGEIRVGVSKLVKGGKKAVAKHQRQQQRKAIAKINRDQKRAEAELAKAQAELAVRQTQLQAYRTRQQATKVRRAAGQFTPAERVSGTLAAIGSQGANFARGFIQDSKTRRKVTSKR